MHHLPWYLKQLVWKGRPFYLYTQATNLQKEMEVI